MKEKTSISQKLQKFGSVLAGMVIPNIGAFIGFGLITAFFLETGWTPNAKLAKLISPILNYLLPILIGHTGGKMFGGDRGGVIGALVTMGAIVAVDGTPMFLAAMILGPVAGVCIKKFDQAVDGKIPSGFEMIVNNFSLGIIGAILCCFAMLVFGPVMETVTTVLTNGVNWIVAHNALPLSAIFVEPAKVLFLNNALDHGIFGPIGYEQVKTLGHSALFLLVPNPGAGLGLLLAYWFFGKGEMKEAAPGMILIHFFGGIHEVYFPYVLANPLTIIGMIAGGIVGTGTLTFLNVGTVATPSPGSIFSVVALSPKNCMFGVLLSVVLSCVVSFLLNTIFVKRMVAKGGDTSLGESVVPKEAMGSSASSNESTAITNDSSLGVAGVDIKNIKKIVVACDAGMGSSAMGATKFRNRIKPLNLGITVTNTSVDNVPADADVVVCQYILQDRAVKSAPQARLVAIGNFLQDPNLDTFYAELEGRANGTSASAPAVEPEVKEEKKAKKAVLKKEGIKTGLKSVDKETAIRAAGQLLCDLGFTNEDYIQAMVDRENMVSTYMGMGVAIPHGTSNAKETVKKSGIVVMQYPEGVDFGDEKAYLVIGIAGVGDEHLEILGNIVASLEDEELLETLKKNADVDTIMKTFG
jgi:PTS system mannitol-specific IIC component